MLKAEDATAEEPLYFVLSTGNVIRVDCVHGKPEHETPQLYRFSRDERRSGRAGRGALIFSVAVFPLMQRTDSFGASRPRGCFPLHLGVGDFLPIDPTGSYAQCDYRCSQNRTILPEAGRSGST